MIFLWIGLAYVAGFFSCLFAGLVYQIYKIYEHDRPDKNNNWGDWPDLFQIY